MYVAELTVMPSLGVAGMIGLEAACKNAVPAREFPATLCFGEAAAELEGPQIPKVVSPTPFAPVVTLFAPASEALEPDDNSMEYVLPGSPNIMTWNSVGVDERLKALPKNLCPDSEPFFANCNTAAEFPEKDSSTCGMPVALWLSSNFSTRSSSTVLSFAGPILPWSSAFSCDSPVPVFSVAAAPCLSVAFSPVVFPLCPDFCKSFAASSACFFRDSVQPARRRSANASASKARSLPFRFMGLYWLTARAYLRVLFAFFAESGQQTGHGFFSGIRGRGCRF